MNPHPIPAVRFDTDLMPNSQAFDIWQTILDEFYEVVPARSAGQGNFAAALDMWNIDGLTLTHGSFTPQRFVRTARRARRDGLDNYTFLMHSRGKWRADAAGRPMESAEGSVCVVDFARPLVSEVTLNDSITLSLPRELLDGVLPPRNLHGMVLNGPQGGLLRDFLLSLTRRLPDLGAGQAPFIAAACRDLLAACLSPSPAMAERAQPQLDALSMRRARQIIDENMHRPDFGAEDLRLALGVSRATLYRMFRRLRGVSEHIRARRLAHAHALLVKSNGWGRISEVARLCGFTSDAHFSRAFRDAYGYTPRDAMTSVTPSLLRQPGAARTPSGVDGVIIDWIRQLAG
ncbi:MAG: AraC family transcriptional regulator [Xanthobacteraceae bacterium]|nr:AraC family transcriptional regulator [Xanthobacteraceae bacterium]